MKRLLVLLLLAVVACGRGAPLSTEDELRRVAFEEGLQLLSRSGMDTPHPVCAATRVEYHIMRGYVVEDPSPGLVHALRGTHPLMRRAGACTFTDNEAVKGAFGLPGVLMWVDSVSVRPRDRAVARIGYHVEPQYGAEFRCGFQLRERAWHVTRCDLLWVS